MSYELAIGIFFAGVATGMFLAGKADLGAKVINEIGKVKTKGDNSPIDTELIQEIKPKRGIFRKIFSKKVKA